MALDRFDRALLNLIQENAGQTAEQLAAQIPVSASAIQRRLRRLKDDGIIVREAAILDPQKIGRPTFFIVSLQVERERPELLARLRAWLGAQQHIQQVYYVTGEADFVLVLAVPDTEAFDKLMSRLLTENPNVQHFTSNVALSVVKRGLSIPLPTDAAD